MILLITSTAIIPNTIPVQVTTSSIPLDTAREESLITRPYIR